MSRIQISEPSMCSLWTAGGVRQLWAPKLAKMVESTRANPLLLLGEYNNPGVRVRATAGEVLLVAASQSIDHVFPDWVSESRLVRSEFQPTDANYPLRVPRRDYFKTAITADPPLSQLGLHLAGVLGRQLVEYGMRPARVYAGPSLKSLQTASVLGKAFKQPLAVQRFPGFWGEHKAVDGGFLLAPEAAATFGLSLEACENSALPSGDLEWSVWRRQTVQYFEQLLAQDAGHVVLVVDRVVFKTLAVHAIYGAKTDFRSETELQAVDRIFPASTLSLVRHNGNLRMRDHLFPSYTTKDFTTRIDFDWLEEGLVLA